MNRIVVAMSGGVDSSVAAALLVEQGYDVIGMTMQLWDYGSRKQRHAGRCCASEDIEDARRVAHHLKIPFYAVNFQHQFFDQVVRPFMEDYVSGRTPSPCVNCNSGLKFHELVRVADKICASYVATGHYVRTTLNAESGRYEIRKARDLHKDQSYFLFNLTQKQISRALFPLGEYTKAEVRDLARKFQLPVPEKPESQQLCFLQGEEQGSFIDRRLSELSLAGNMVDSVGNVVRRHEGIHHYTIGQRRGLGVAAGEPQYVTAIDPATNLVRIGSNEELMKSSMRVEQVNWVGITAPLEDLAGRVRIRSRHEETAATIRPSGDGVVVEFAESQRAITPGQAAVFYNGDLLLGGGWIARVN